MKNIASGYEEGSEDLWLSATRAVVNGRATPRGIEKP
jgi:hypothetical protein